MRRQNPNREKGAHMKFTFSILLICALLLTGCNLPAAAPTAATPAPQAEKDRIDTQVAKLLTQLPSATPLTAKETPLPTATRPAAPEAAASATPVPPTATPVPPTATAAPSATALPPTAAPTEAPTATVSAADPVPGLGAPTWKDEFTKNSYFGTFDETETKVEVSGGALVLTAKNANSYYGWTMSYPKPKNFYLEATVKTGSCSSTDRYGLIFRSPDTSKGYFLTVTCDGQYSFRAWDGSEFSDIVAWTKTAAIKTGGGQTNRIGVLAKDKGFTFFVNGVKVGDASDGTYTEGGLFGVCIAAKATAGFNVAVDHIEYWKLD